jgi:hypothetical protein
VVQGFPSSSAFSQAFGLTFTPIPNDVSTSKVPGSHFSKS